MINSSESQGKTTSWATTSSNIRDTLASYERQLAESRELDERAERIRKEAAESRKSTQETIDRLSNTISKIQGTLNGVEETNKRFEEFEQSYKNMMEKAIQNLVNAFDPKNNLTGGSPIQATAKSAAEAMSKCKKIMLLTGAGISVASGIPTFRGEGGFWTTRDSKSKLKAIDFLTFKFFKENPAEIWRWHHVFKRLKEKSRYNDAHREIAEFQCFCLKNNIPLLLVTQNIDEFHVEAFEDVVKKYPEVSSKIPQDWKDVKSDRYGLHPQVLAIHGSVNYIRHHDNNENAPKRLFSYPESYDDDTMPLIDGQPSRPHTLLFDENYNEEFYRCDTVGKFASECDCLVVVGTALETNMASRLVSSAVSRKITVIEINPDPCIIADGVLQLKGTSEQFLQEMFRLARQEMGKELSTVQKAGETEEKKTNGGKTGQVTTVTSTKQVNQAAPTKPMNQQQKPRSTLTTKAAQTIVTKPSNQNQIKQKQTTTTTSTRKPTLTSSKGQKK